MTLNEGGDMTVVGAAQQIALTVAGDGSIFDLCGPDSSDVRDGTGMRRAAYTPLDSRMPDQSFFSAPRAKS